MRQTATARNGCGGYLLGENIMNMPFVLIQMIQKHFKNKLMPGIIEVYKKLQVKHGKDVASDPKAGIDFNLSSFGYQTSFMMRYMSIAFGIVSILLLVLGLTVNPGSLEGLKIFVVFFVLCLLLWLVTLRKTGYIVYTTDWIYVKRCTDFKAFGVDQLVELKVKGDLALVFENYKGERIVVKAPLEGEYYEKFMSFCEQCAPEVIQKIDPEDFQKARRKHVSAWKNYM